MVIEVDHGVTGIGENRDPVSVTGKVELKRSDPGLSKESEVSQEQRTKPTRGTGRKRTNSLGITATEGRVLKALYSGQTQAAISQTLKMNENTVRMQIRRLKLRMKVQSLMELTTKLFAIDLDLLDEDR
jgi:DNA-binding CsgD family transcriptional regulator